MTVLYRIGARVFSLDHVEEINLKYDPNRYDKLKPPSKDAGVEVILSSGRRLPPFFDAEAQVLRDYLNGEAVTSRRTRTGHGVDVIELIPAEVEPEVAPAFQPEAAWGLDESAPIVHSIP